MPVHSASPRSADSYSNALGSLSASTLNREIHSLPTVPEQVLQAVQKIADEFRAIDTELAGLQQQLQATTRHMDMVQARQQQAQAGGVMPDLAEMACSLQQTLTGLEAKRTAQVDLVNDRSAALSDLLFILEKRSTTSQHLQALMTTAETDHKQVAAVWASVGSRTRMLQKSHQALEKTSAQSATKISRLQTELHQLFVRQARTLDDTILHGVIRTFNDRANFDLSHFQIPATAKETRHYLFLARVLQAMMMMEDVIINFATRKMPMIAAGSALVVAAANHDLFERPAGRATLATVAAVVAEWLVGTVIASFVLMLVSGIEKSRQLNDLEVERLHPDLAKTTTEGRERDAAGRRIIRGDLRLGATKHAVRNIASSGLIGIRSPMRSVFALFFLRTSSTKAAGIHFEKLQKDIEEAVLTAFQSTMQTGNETGSHVVETQELHTHIKLDLARAEKLVKIVVKALKQEQRKSHGDQLEYLTRLLDYLGDNPASVAQQLTKDMQEYSELALRTMAGNPQIMNKLVEINLEKQGNQERAALISRFSGNAAKEGVQALDTQGRMDLYQQKIAVYRFQQARLQEETTLLQQQRMQLEQACLDLQQRVAELDSEIASCRSELGAVTVLQKQASAPVISKTQSDIRQANAEKNGIKRQISGLHARTAEKASMLEREPAIAAMFEAQTVNGALKRHWRRDKQQLMADARDKGYGSNFGSPADLLESAVSVCRKFKTMVEHNPAEARLMFDRQLYKMGKEIGVGIRKGMLIQDALPLTQVNADIKARTGKINHIFPA